MTNKPPNPTTLKLPCRKCDCALCKTSREIQRICKLLPKADAAILDGIFNASFEYESDLEIDISNLESAIADIYISAARANNKYYPAKTKEKLEQEALHARTKPKGL